MGACARFKVEGFEVLSPGLFLRSKGSRFGCVCSIQGRRVRGLVAWSFIKVEGFEVCNGLKASYNDLRHPIDPLYRISSGEQYE